jgi:hypothetical protein
LIGYVLYREQNVSDPHRMGKETSCENRIKSQ